MAVQETTAYPRIPYGESDFRRIRLNRWLYVDKTRFLRRLERERYAFLIRPRRFGKSLWVSLLENYYDRWWAASSTLCAPAPTSGATRRRARYPHLPMERAVDATGGSTAYYRWPEEP